MPHNYTGECIGDLYDWVEKIRARVTDLKKNATTEVLILEHYSSDGISKKINDHLAEGWQMDGEIVCVGDGPYNYVQKMKRVLIE